MARAHLRFPVKDRAGNAIQNALVTFYRKGTGPADMGGSGALTTPVGSVYAAETGGSALADWAFESNNQGEVEAWVDTPQSLDAWVTDNSDAAYYPSNSAKKLTFTGFGERVEVHLPPEDEPGSVALPGLTDVDDATVPTSGHFLRGDGTDWSNSAIQDADIPASITRDSEAALAYQPLDTDLSTISGLDSSQSGIMASDGAGWFRKTYAAVKTALGLSKSDVGLGNVDNTSDADKPVSTAQQTALDLKQSTSEKGQASGYASLDGGGKVPVAQLPNSIMEYQGTWNATTNSPTLADGTGSAGDVYRVSVAGSQDLGSGSISFAVGDYAVYNGSTWEKSDTTDSVPTVFGRTGNVTAQSGDYTKAQVGLGNVDNTSDADKPVSTAQQAALDAKQALSEKGQNNGYASLDSEGKVPDAQIPAAITRDTELQAFVDRVMKGEVFFNVKDYGAVGDGATNDRQAFQDAADAASAAGGGIVWAPKGTYLISKNGVSNTAILWPSKVALIGAGVGVTKLTASGSAYSLIKNTTGSSGSPITDVRFENFEIDGSGHTDVSYSADAKGIYFQYLRRGIFKNLYIHDCAASGLGIDYLDGGHIDGVSTYNNGRAWDSAGGGASGIGVGVGAYVDEPVSITDCIALDNANFGIFVEYQSGQTYRSHYVRINNCHAKGNRVGIGDRGAGRTLVSNSTMSENDEDGFNCSNGGLEGRLSDCIIRSNGRYGVFFDSSCAGKWKVVDNDIAANTSHNVYIKGGSGLAEMQVKGNDIFDGQLVGILLEGTLTNLDISQNRLFNNGRASTSGYTAGLRSDATITNLKCLGNKATDDQGVKTQTIGMRFVTGSSVTSGHIEGNDVRGNGSTSLQIQATFTTCVVRNNPGFDSGATGSRPSAAAVGAGSEWFDTTIGKTIVSDGTNWLAPIYDALMDAKGDIIVATAADTPARLAVGTSVVDRLIPDSAATPGLKWAKHIVRRTADTSPITSTTALQTDDTLLFAVAANEVWWWEAFILLTGANAVHDIKFGWSLPAGCTMLWGTLGGLMNEVAAWGGRLATSSPAAMLTESQTLVNGTAAVTSATAMGGILEVGANAGNANLQWAQQNSDPGALKLLKNSFLRLTRLA